MARVRNRSGAKDPILRPKRLGIGWQQLVANVAVMVDLFRAGLKHGWLASARRQGQPYPDRVLAEMRAKRTRLMEQVEARVTELRFERRNLGLDGCLPPSAPPRPPP